LNGSGAVRTGRISAYPPAWTCPRQSFALGILGVYDAIVEKFGKDSDAFDRFKVANQNANEYKN